MASDIASNAAAVSAGYTSTATDRGANANPRWRVVLEKRLVAAGHSCVMFRAMGEGSSQANAETAAPNALNGQRKHGYGSARRTAPARALAPRSRWTPTTSLTTATPTPTLSTRLGTAQLSNGRNLSVRKPTRDSGRAAVPGVSDLVTTRAARSSATGMARRHPGRVPVRGAGRRKSGSVLVS
jgi:hypothetical protein